jgi:AhpD family alkylhydroperoxidase
MTARLDYVSVASDGMKAFRGVHQYVAKSGLPHDLIDIVYLRVSLINGCGYCVDRHTRDLIKGGMKIDKIALIPVWDEAESFFTEQERAALLWAETITNISKTHAPEADYKIVAAQFDEKQLADLTIAISLMNAYNRIAIAFHRGPEPH